MPFSSIEKKKDCSKLGTKLNKLLLGVGDILDLRSTEMFYCSDLITAETMAQTISGGRPQKFLAVNFEANFFLDALLLNQKRRL